MSKAGEINKRRAEKYEVAREAAANLIGDIRTIDTLRSLGERSSLYLSVLEDLYLPEAKYDTFDGQPFTQLVTPEKNENNTSIALVMVNGAEMLLPSRNMMTQHSTQLDQLYRLIGAKARPGEGVKILAEINELMGEAIDKTLPFSLQRLETKDEGRQQTISKEVTVSIGSVPYVLRGRSTIYLPMTETLPRASVGRMLFHGLGHAVKNLYTEPRPEAKNNPWPAIEEGQLKRIDDKVAQATLLPRTFED